MTSECILVGVDGGEGGDAAVRYAAVEAARLGIGIKLIHVAPQLAYSVAVDPQNAPGKEHRRERMLVDAAELAQRTLRVTDPSAPDLPIMTEVAFGGRVERLVEASEGCRLVVLGDQHRPLLDRIVAGSVLAGVAARARVPVVRAPAGQRAVGSHAKVIAAVKDTEEGSALLEDALSAAEARGAHLTLLHAWQAPPLYEDLTTWPEYVNEWEERAQQALTELLATRRSAHPGVKVDVRVVHGQPAKVIVDASREAGLVLIARRSHLLAPGHLGGTARAVLRESLCPVEVLPPGDAVGLDEVTLEEAGRLHPAIAGPVD